MSADAHRFSGKFSDLTHEILGAAFEVSNSLGIGLLEKPYENALVFELSSRGIQVDQQKQFQILYKEKEVGLYVPDLIANNQVIIDTKVIEKTTNIERAQMLNYLRVTNLELGLILNFKHPKLEYERIILDQ